MTQLPVCDLEDVWCRPVRPLRLFNHLPSCYVDRRTSAHLILLATDFLPRSSIAPLRLHLTPRGPCCRPELRPSQCLIRMGKEDLTLSALCAGPLPALVHASLLMSALPSHTFANSPQFYLPLVTQQTLTKTFEANTSGQRPPAPLSLFFFFIYFLDVLSSVIKTMNKK